MLKIVIPSTEIYDEEENRFTTIPEKIVKLEHSLFSISKWESKWHKPFISKQERTNEENYDYFRCMSLDEEEPIETFYRLEREEQEQILRYIEDPMTATTINDHNTSKGNPFKIITAEEIYYAMIAFNIPMECQHWHLNRLLTLIRICSIRNQPPKKMSKSEILNRNRSLNAARRAATGSRG